MVCSHCNFEMDEVKEYCPRCGRKMSGRKSVTPVEDKNDNQSGITDQSINKPDRPVSPKNKPNYVVLVLFVLLLVLAGRGLYSLVCPVQAEPAADQTTSTVTEVSDAEPITDRTSDSSDIHSSQESASEIVAEDVQNEEYDTITTNTSVGDRVLYGAYERDNDLENGDEPIEWIVIDVKDGQYLLIASEIIDEVCYNDVWEQTTWESCSLRTWLNESFLERAFSESQQHSIVYTRNTNEDSFSTNDRVFILNGKELQEYFASMENRAAGASPYAEARGVYEYDNGNCWWWVRDAGEDPHYACYVNCIGDILNHGMLVFNNSFGVRPAIWVSK